MKVLKSFLVCVACLAIFSLSLLAQAQKTCVPEKTFINVGSLLEKNDYQRVKTLLRGLEACPHLSPRQRFNIGWLYGKAQDASDALRLFRSVQMNVPDQLTHGYAIALAHFELGQYQASIDTLTALRSKGVFAAKAADLLGVSYSKLDRYQDAYAVLADNIRQNPSDAYGYANLVALFVDTSELDKAAQVADKAVVALPQNPDALSMRGSLEVFRDQMDEAYRDFAAAAQLAPLAPDPPFFMALVDYRKSQFDEAVKVLRNAIRSGVVDSDLHYMLAECLLRLDSSDSTTLMSELDAAIQLNPNSVSARVLRGSTLLNAGRPQDAIVDLKLARDLDPRPQRDRRNAVYLLARAYAAVGKQEEAHALFAEVGAQFRLDKVDTVNQLGDQKMRAALHR